MDDYVAWWLEIQASEGGFAQFNRAIKPNSAHRGTRDVWGEWLGLRIDYDADSVTFTEYPGQKPGVAMSIDEARQVLRDAQDKLMGR